MSQISWLHLTDFHQGMTGQNRLLPEVEEKFFEDLVGLRKKCGFEWDLVLFTGDLTYRAYPEEFEELNKWLDRLWNFFSDTLKFKNTPLLLSVPGNHDVYRPGIKENDLEWEDTIDILKKAWRREEWESASSRRESFWNKPDSRYRKVIEGAFNNYMDWWNTLDYRPKNGLNNGILPGDFSYTFEKDDAQLGLLGLNNSFLHLDSSEYKGSLGLDVIQFNEACAPNGPAWVRQHNTCLLMTHHPPSWLCQDSREQLQQNILDTRNFAVHLCGHLHEAAYSQEGSMPQRTLQGRSLFGLSHYRNSQQRSHGYSLGVIELKGKKGRLFFYPRKLDLQEDRYQNIIPDHYFILNDLQHTNPETREFELTRRHTNSSSWKTYYQPEQRDFDPASYRILVQDVVAVQSKLFNYKLLHEELQKTSLRLSLFLSELIPMFSSKMYEDILFVLKYNWSGCRRRIEKVTSLSGLPLNAKSEFETKYESDFLKIENSAQIVQIKTNSWTTANDVEDNWHDFIGNCVSLVRNMDELLTKVDNELKIQINAFKEHLRNLSTPLNIPYS